MLKAVFILIAETLAIVIVLVFCSFRVETLSLFT